jgi:hypothetical protein
MNKEVGTQLKHDSLKTNDFGIDLAFNTFRRRLGEPLDMNETVKTLTHTDFS